MSSTDRSLACIGLAISVCLCGSCSYATAGYNIILRPIDGSAGTPLDAAHVRVQLLRGGVAIGLDDFEGVAYPLGGDRMEAWVTVDAPEVRCVLWICSEPTPMELGDPPDVAQVTVRDGERTGFASVPIAPEDIVIEDEIFGSIELGTVEVSFQP